MSGFREIGIIRDPQPNDVLVVTVPRNTSPEFADRIGETTRQKLGCRVVVVSNGVRIGDDGAAAELAALKARRCDGCEWYGDRSTPLAAYGTCTLANSEYGAPLVLDGDAESGELLVEADHACNAWTAKS